MITSRNNPLVKELATLHKSKGRRELECTLVEGAQVVREALCAEIVHSVILSEFGVKKHPDLLEAKCGRIVELSDSCFEKISSRKNPEGVAAMISLDKLPGGNVFDITNVKLAVASGVQDPQNAGAIVRVAEAAGVSACVFISGKDGGIDPTAPKFLRATTGSAFRVPCVSMDSDIFLKEIVKNSVSLIAADAQTEGAVSFKDADYSSPCAICLGAEGKGVAEEILSAASQRVFIPMCGKTESLNVAVAAGLLLYQAGWA